MKNLIALTSLFLITLSSAANAHEHGHKHHGKKHSHGDVKLEMAVEKNVLEFELEGPAESFLGFEHAPKTDKEKKTFEDTKALFTQTLLSKVFVFKDAANCTVTSIEFEQEFEEKEAKKGHDHKHSGEHSEIKVEGKITCADNLDKKSLEVVVKEHFNRIKTLEIEVIGAQATKVTSKKNKELITL